MNQATNGLDDDELLALARRDADGGRVEEALRKLKPLITRSEGPLDALAHTTLLGGLAEGLARAGQIAEGLATIEEALALCERSEERWCAAELARIKGELVLAQGAPQAAVAAEKCFLRALDWARRRETLTWELRAATSLSRVWLRQGRSGDARGLLEPVYERFTEGFRTLDLMSAKALLDTLR